MTEESMVEKAFKGGMSSQSGGSSSEANEKGGWASLLTGGLILMAPVFAVLGLGSLMGLRTASARLDWLRTVPEHRQLVALASVPEGTTVLLYGRLAPDAEADSIADDDELLIYSERPLRTPGRRFTEDLPQVFPTVLLELDDGSVRILPSTEGERPLHDAPHTFVDPAGEWERQGFRAGDLVSIQGEWQPASADEGARPTLLEATGLSGQSKAEMSAELDQAWTRVSIFGWVTTLLSVVGLVALAQRWRARKRSDGAA